MVPNHQSIVDRVYAAGNFNLRTREGCGQLVEAAVPALHAVDKRWGYLKKSGGTHYNWHSHDGALYLSDTPGQSIHVDFIANAESHKPEEVPRIYWNPDIPRYSASDWLAPSGVTPGTGGTGGGTTPGPVCPDPSAHQPKPALRFDRGELYATLIELDRYYRERDGLNRGGTSPGAGLLKGGLADLEGMAAWMFDLYLNARVQGKSDAAAREDMKAAIRQSAEWRAAHPGETP